MLTEGKRFVIETAARGAQFLLAIGIAYLIALWFALVAWTFRDIEARSRSVFTQVFSTLLVVLFFVPGLLALSHLATEGDAGPGISARAGGGVPAAGS